MSEDFDINNLSLFPLYHGTDLRIVKMDKDDRESFRISCMEIVEYLWQIFKPYYENDKFLSVFRTALCSDNKTYRWLNLCEKLDMINSMHSGNEQYQYDTFHLTTSKDTAINYARRSFAFGEIGLLAYRMYEAIRILDLKEFAPDNDMQFEIDMLVEFAEDYNYQPAIFEINNLDLSKVSIEGNPSLKDLIRMLIKKDKIIVHYSGEVELNPYDAILLKK